MVDYDPYQDEIMRDPYRIYRQLRDESPVHYIEQYDYWFLSRFEDVWEATGSDAFTTAKGVMPESVFFKEHPPADPPVFTMLDMPRQRPYRKVLSPAYGKRTIAKLEEQIRETKSALGDAKQAEERADLENQLASRRQRQERLLAVIKQRENADS